MIFREIRERGGVSDASVKAITSHFRDNTPILLDGALARHSARRHLVRQARAVIARGHVDPETLAPEILRETLDAVAANAATVEAERVSPCNAGFVAVGANHARIWWDESALGNLDDILSRLDNPKTVLRFYDVTDLDPESGRWHESFDIDVKLADFGHTAHFMRGDRVYVVDLGCVHGEGRFLRLARTNPVALPRDGRGVPDDGDDARTILRPRNRREEAALVPDAAAREWAAARPDSPDRDVDAELAVHMLYRAFLTEGSRALRRGAFPLVRRDAAVLEREYAERERRRAWNVAKQRSSTEQIFLVARLDRAKPASAGTENVFKFLPAPAASVAPAAASARAAWADSAEAGAEHFAWHEAVLALARSFEIETEESDGVTMVDAEIEPRRARDLVRVLSPLERADRAGRTASLYSAPVFRAAESLRERIRNVSSAPKPDQVFGGLEAKRMAKAGVRITRMALTLEGRMRPGARLKVAGRLVRADADGRFRLECVLSGKKASIPMRAGVSTGGEARSLINVEWEKRAVAERK